MAQNKDIRGILCSIFRKCGSQERDRRKREKNLKDCFRVRDPEKIKNKDIVVIDDVLTTGSPLKEMRATLLAAGAKSVLSFTIAH